MEYFLGIDYPTLWFLIVGALLSAYGILEGFDLGSGSLHIFLRQDQSRRININAIAPIWDANQVFLIIGGGALFAGFPVMYAALMSSMYIPFMVFLFFLVLRAMAIKYRSAEDKAWWRTAWDWIYFVSNVSISFLLGVVVGNVLQGLAIDKDLEYKGGVFFGFFSFYSVLVGLTSVSLFMMQGAAFLLLKTQDKLYARLTMILRNAVVFFLVSFSFTSLYTLVFIEGVVENFREEPEYFIVPVFTFLAVANIPRLIRQKKYELVFVFSSLTTAFLMMLVALQLYPVLLPSTIDSKFNITIYNAASSMKSLEIMLLFAAVGTPLIGLYMWNLYKTFRGKVELDDFSY
ncbi:cytochrome d ubiquinol oxidase subunit II [Rhodoflexus caldus]|uniref:cytochrome d ubiquinol oxidase subunit II n=1 Tax=Rhodoflexus caldus TaxID=2891236 RepID=UPI00202A75C1|nr:cytochrome d ubiquinol oxidase subunit II [Rhodoflexus caldus]